MTFKRSLIVLMAGFCLACIWMIGRSVTQGTRSRFDSRGLLLLQQTTDVDPGPAVPEAAPQTLAPAPAPTTTPSYNAVGGPAETVTVGSVDKESGFKFRLELDSRGAAIRQATFSDFKDRDHENPQPLNFLSPVQVGPGREMLSMATMNLDLVDQQVRLNLSRLSWQTLGTTTDAEGATVVSFEATITDAQDKPFLKLTKSYRVTPGSYLVECTMTIDNLSDAQQRVQYDLAGPLGLEREAFRQDMRSVIAGFRNNKGEVVRGKLQKKDLIKAGRPLTIESKNGGRFLWASVVNKYFAAILVPMPQTGEDYANWIAGRFGVLYNPDADQKADNGDETIGVDLSTTAAELAPAGQANGSRTYNFDLYLGPKDKSLFDKNEMYRSLGFVQTIDFRGCCCPSSIINPLAFGILAIMKGMYHVIPNYGVVIIILVFLMRLAMHPITKKSQVSMSKMSKLAPRAEEIKKKYANNKAEMNKRLMELYREQGASPITGMLPMFIQMPIWIALWSAVYTSIDLRGAAFLPFWITDLSVPDALVRFPTITVPLLGWHIESLNLLPILMGIAFYLQQKLMPTQTNAATNPQMAQQQKMMMIMMPLLFPLMLYKAPSGVNLYIMSSTFAGVIEQYVIRKHIREKEAEESKGLVAATSKTGGKVKKKKPKPFFKS